MVQYILYIIIKIYSYLEYVHCKKFQSTQECQTFVWSIFRANMVMDIGPTAVVTVSQGPPGQISQTEYNQKLQTRKFLHSSMKNIPLKVPQSEEKVSWANLQLLSRLAAFQFGHIFGSKKTCKSASQYISLNQLVQSEKLKFKDTTFLCDCP